MDETQFSGILPSNFWDTLKPDVFDRILNEDKSYLELNCDSHNGSLNIRTRRDNSLENPRYHVTITSNEVLAARKSSQSSPLDNPDYIVSSRTFTDFNQAVGVHYAALHKLSELGY